MLLACLALAADPPSALAACPGAQRCGERCIPWTEVCRDTLADSIGLQPPSPVPADPGPPGSAPAGSTLLGLPAVHGAGGPTMAQEAPKFCHEGNIDPVTAVACVPFWSVGPGASASAPAPLLADCPQHRRCNGVCLADGAVCPTGNADMASDGRLSPFDPSAPTRDGYAP